MIRKTKPSVLFVEPNRETISLYEKQINREVEQRGISRFEYFSVGTVKGAVDLVEKMHFTVVVVAPSVPPSGPIGMIEFVSSITKKVELIIGAVFATSNRKHVEEMARVGVHRIEERHKVVPIIFHFLEQLDQMSC